MSGRFSVCWFSASGFAVSPVRHEHYRDAEVVASDANAAWPEVTHVVVDREAPDIPEWELDN